MLGAPEDLEELERPAGGGLVADLDLHSGDLHDLAALAAQSDGPEAAALITRILERANAHEEEHIERLLVAREHPRSIGLELWRKYGLRHSPTSHDTAKVLQASRERLARGRALLADPSPLRDTAPRGRLVDVAVRRLVRPSIIARLLRDPQAGLDLAKQAAARISPGETADRVALADLADAAAAARLVAARQVAGHGVNPLTLIAHSPRLALSRQQLDHQGGDRAERLRAKAHPTFWCDPQTPLLMTPPKDLHRTDQNRLILPPASDAAAARARARGLLRDPEAHEGRREAERPGRLVHVPVTEGALHELLGDEGEDPDLVMLRGPGNEALVHLALRRRARVDGHQIEVRYTLELGTTARRSITPMTAELMPVDLPEPADVIDWPTGDGALAVARGHHSDAPGPHQSLEEFLGRDVCAHPGASWHLNGSRSATFLSCPRCLRRRVVTLPLHRVPPQDPLWPESTLDDAGYLTRERYRRALFGEPALAAGTTVADLRAADGVADMAPAAYAHEPTVAPAGRHHSLAGAFSSRRAPGPAAT